MKKQRKSSTESRKAIPLERTSYVSPYGSPETLDYMKQCEAREWIKRFNQRTGEHGSANAQSWWLQVCADIEKRRGAEALADLRRRMNEERKNEQSRAK